MPIRLLVLAAVGGVMMLLIWLIPPVTETNRGMERISTLHSAALVGIGIALVVLAFFIFFRYLGLLRQSRAACLEAA